MKAAVKESICPSEVNASYAQVTGFTNNTAAHKVEPSQSQAVHARASTSPAVDQQDRKFNIIIFGLKEQDAGTSKFTRTSQDQSSVERILSSLNPNIPGNSIRDCFRLGKYKRERSRPILVKLLRVCDVNSILANRRNLASTPNISIRPDLPPEQRKVEAILLKERYHLIQSGTDKKSIRLRGNCLFVNNAKYGSVTQSKFHPVSDITTPTQPATEPLLPSAAPPSRIASTTNSINGSPSTEQDDTSSLVRSPTPSSSFRPSVSSNLNPASQTTTHSPSHST